MLLYQQAIQLYLQSLIARNLRQSYVVTTNRALTAFVNYTPIPLPEKLQPQDVSNYLVHLLTNNYAGSTVKSNRAAIVTWLSWLSMEGYIDEVDWNGKVQHVKVDAPDPLYLNKEAIQAFITTTATMSWRCEFTRRRNYALVCLLIDSGLRENELLTLRMCDVDTTRCLVNVRAEVSKSRRDRTVWFSSETQNALRAYLRLRRKRGGELFWVSRDHNALSKSTLLQIVHRISRTCGIQDVTVHALRHTCATSLRRNGMDVSGISAILGHSNIRTTMRYVHLVDKDVKDEYAKYAPLASHI